jgi:hypothetical protein
MIWLMTTVLWRGWARTSGGTCPSFEWQVLQASMDTL